MGQRFSARKVYVVGGKRVVLTADPALRAVRLAGTAPSAEHAPPPALGAGSFRLPGENFVVLRAGGGAAPADTENGGPVRANGTDNPADTEEEWPVFRLGRDHRTVVVDRVLVGMAGDEGDPAAQLKPVLERLLGPRGYEIVRQHGRTVTVRLLARADPFVVSRSLRRRRGVAFVEPDTVTLFNPVAPLPEPDPENGPMRDAAAPAGTNHSLAAAAVDPLAVHQHALRQIRADQVGHGRPGVVIAVLDAPVDVGHPDLKDAISNALDVLAPGNSAAPDAHATACAGLAAAVPGNNIGVRGVGAGCKLLPIRFATPTSNSLFPLSGSMSDAARAIDKAWQDGAWVISLSWVFAIAGEMTNAIERARTLGRGGKGCVVVAGVGNDGTGVHFPAKIPGVLAVGACTRDDEPKTRRSSDNQKDWSSCRGKEVSISAPGVENFTTDVSGPGGYRGGPNGDYVPNFRGTSSATPIVAGAAALVLSANPCLKEEQVRKILCDTAFRKQESVPFDADGHNERMGFGRVDVLAAVNEALRLRAPGGTVPCDD